MLSTKASVKLNKSLYERAQLILTKQDTVQWTSSSSIYSSAS